MKQFFYLSAICTLLLAACTGSFKKGDEGLEYKIIAKGSGKTIGYGEYMQIHVKQVYEGTKDTVLLNSRDFMPRIQLFDSVNTPMAYFKIIRQMKKGDSLIIRILTDTAYKGSEQGMPPFMTKGKYIYTHVSLVNIFATQAQADSANKAESIGAKPRIFKKQVEEIEKDILNKKVQNDIDNKLILTHLSTNNIAASKTKWGTFIAIQSEGTGPTITNNDVVKVMYTGRTLDSNNVFDSNIDPKFNHPQPLEVNVGELGSVILGWSDALMNMKMGTKATIYIPSSLGYGLQGNGEKIKPNSNLVFDMEVIEVTSLDVIMARQEEFQRQMAEAEKRRMDSIQNAPKK